MNNSENAQMQQLLAQLADINGLAGISWWPLAMGWWVVLAVIALMIAVAIFVLLRRRAYRRGWKFEINNILNDLDQRLDAANGREIMAELSTILRRLAMRNSSRHQSAGLKGAEWAEWLEKNDPGEFNWANYTNLLTETPYAPPGNPPPPDDVKALIKATRRWIR